MSEVIGGSLPVGGVEAVTASSEYNTSYTPEEAFNGVTTSRDTDRWICVVSSYTVNTGLPVSGDGEWYQFEFTITACITKIKLITGSSPKAAPKKVTFYVSDTGAFAGEETNCGDVTYASEPDADDWTDWYEIPTPTSGLYLRVEINSIWPDYDKTYTIVPEWVLFEKAEGSITLNPFDKHVNLTLSNNNLTTTYTHTISENSAVRATSGKSSGKWYFEVYINIQTGANHTIGVMDGSHSLNMEVGADASAVGVGWQTDTGNIYYDGTFVAYGGSADAGDYVQVALDLATGNIWFGVNNTWLLSGDPANNNNPSYTESELTSGEYFAAITQYYSNSNHQCTVRFSSTDLVGTIPTGFSSYEESTPISLTRSPILRMFKPVSTFGPKIAFPIETITRLLINTSWKLPIQKIQTTAWSVKTVEDVESSWIVGVKTTLFPTTWKVVSVTEADTAYSIFKTDTIDTSWKLPIQTLVETAYQVLGTISQDVSWKLPIILECDTSYRVRTSTDAEVLWYLLHSTEWDTAYRIRTQVTKDAAWSVKTVLSATLQYRIQPALSADTSWRLSALTTKETSWRVKSSPNGNIAWKIIEDAGNIPGIDSHVVSVTVAGTPIDPVSISLSNDFDSIAWSASLGLSTEAEYDLCVANAEIIISIDSVVFVVNVKKQDKSMAFINNTWKVTALSPFGLVADEQISLTLDNETLVSDVAEVIVGSSVSLSWNTINWKLPADFKVAENATRKSVLAALVSAVGAKIISDFDGSLFVVPETPIDEVKNNPTGIWTTDDIDTVSDSILSQPVYKRVLAGSDGLHIPRNVSINVREKDDVERTAVVAVRVTPEPVTPTVTDAGPSTINIVANQEVIATETETVVFKDGAASVGSDILALVSVDWGGHTDLGTIEVVGPNNIISSVIGDSLGEIEYTTKYYEYVVSDSGSGETTTLICATAPPVRSDIIADCSRGSGDLSPDVLTSRFCTELVAAAERGRVYLDLFAGDKVGYNISKVWDGAAISQISDVITFEGDTAVVSSLNISYTFPNVKFDTTVEVLQ